MDSKFDDISYAKTGNPVVRLSNARVVGKVNHRVHFYTLAHSCNSDTRSGLRAEILFTGPKFLTK